MVRGKWRHFSDYDQTHKFSVVDVVCKNKMAVSGKICGDFKHQSNVIYILFKIRPKYFTIRIVDMNTPHTMSYRSVSIYEG